MRPLDHFDRVHEHQYLQLFHLASLLVVAVAQESVADFISLLQSRDFCPRSDLCRSNNNLNCANNNYSTHLQELVPSPVIYVTSK